MGMQRRNTERQPKRLTLANACALGLVLAHGPAFSQQADSRQNTVPPATAQDQTSAPTEAGSKVQTLDTMQVTGIRRSILSSINTKNSSDSIVEAISAEDIGKLPDVSIADSLSRLPGLATQRIDGRSQVINIRGMSEQFVGTTLNGREQVTTGDNRGVEFDQYPAELMGGVLVYKTPDASLIGQGLSGTVDMQSIRPLTFSERRIVFSGQGEYNSLGKLTSGGDDKGYRAAVSYVDQFLDNTLGVAVGVAKLNSPFQERHYKEWWWVDGNTAAGWGAPLQTGKPNDAVALQGWEGTVKAHNIDRTGVMAVVEYKPSDTWHSTLDVYHSKFKQDEYMRGVMSDNSPFWTSQDGTLVGYENVQLGEKFGLPIVTSGSLVNTQPIIRNDNNKFNNTLSAIGWNNTLKFDPWTVDLDVSYSRAKRKQSVMETYAGLLGPQTIQFTTPLTNKFGHYTTPNLADPNTVHLWDPQKYTHDGRMEDSRQTDELKAFRVDINREIASSDFLRSYDIGFNISKRTKEKMATVYFADLLGGAPTLVDPSLIRKSTSLGFLGIGPILTYDPRGALARYYNVQVSESNDDVLKDYSVEENIKTFYFKANLDMDWSDTLRIRGNAGFQYIRTDQSSTGFNANNGVIAGSTTLGAKYGDILPSLNLNFDYGNGYMLRFGWAKEMMRAPIHDLRAASGAGVSQMGLWGGGGGNPRLEPYRANAADLSFEKYFGTSSYVAAALFYKSLESFIYTKQFDNWDFTGYPNDSGYTPISNIGTFSAPANGNGGLMKGVELSTALSGDLFHPSLKNFGALLNASYTESSIDPDGPGGSSTDTIPGLSKVVANATVYYENDNFGIRLSERYRDKYRGEYGALFGQRNYRYTMSEHQLDLQVSYAFPESSSMNGLSLLFQVNNLNNSPFRTLKSIDGQPTPLFLPEEYTEYGRQFLLGFRYEL